MEKLPCYLITEKEKLQQTSSSKPKVITFVTLSSTFKWLIINKSIKQVNSATY